MLSRTIPLLINPPPHSYCSATLAVSTNDLSCTVVFQKVVYTAECPFVLRCASLLCRHGVSLNYFSAQDKIRSSRLLAPVNFSNRPLFHLFCSPHKLSACLLQTIRCISSPEETYFLPTKYLDSTIHCAPSMPNYRTSRII